MRNASTTELSRREELLLMVWRVWLLIKCNCFTHWIYLLKRFSFPEWNNNDIVNTKTIDSKWYRRRKRSDGKNYESHFYFDIFFGMYLGEFIKARLNNNKKSKMVSIAARFPFDSTFELFNFFSLYNLCRAVCTHIHTYTHTYLMNKWELVN